MGVIVVRVSFGSPANQVHEFIVVDLLDLLECNARGRSSSTFLLVDLVLHCYDLVDIVHGENLAGIGGKLLRVKLADLLLLLVLFPVAI
jgi:hypothetical protein